MKTYILTQREKDLIEAFLQEGTTSQQLRNLKARALENLRTLEQDLELVKKYLAAAGVVF